MCLYIFSSSLFAVFYSFQPDKMPSEKGLQKRGRNRAKRPQAKRLRAKMKIIDNFSGKGDFESEKEKNKR